MAFADHYPLSTFREIASLSWWRASDWNTAPSADNPELPAYLAAKEQDATDKAAYEARESAFQAAVLTHLTALRSEGLLKAGGGLKGRNVTLASIWNEFVAGDDFSGKEWKQTHLLDFFDGWLANLHLRISPRSFSSVADGGRTKGEFQPPTDAEITKAWTSLCSDFDTGTHNVRFMAGMRDLYCHLTGDRGALIFTNWQGQFMIPDEQYKYHPAQDVPEIPLVEARFPVPTGKLMLTDALRVKGFNEGTSFDAARDYGDLSLNSELGCARRTTAHAAEHGMAFTQTTNTWVTVYRNDMTGLIMVTERWFNDEDEDPEEDENGRVIIPGWTAVGDFSCDVWSVKAFDKATAISRMTAGGCEGAEAELERYLASPTRPKITPQDSHEACYAKNIVTLDVEPGTWAIHSGPDFADRVDRDWFGIPANVPVWCVLERKA